METIIIVVVGLLAFAIWGIFFADNKSQLEKFISSDKKLQKNLDNMDDGYDKIINKYKKTEENEEKRRKSAEKRKQKAIDEKEKRKQNLYKKYGETFGAAIFSKKIVKDMTKEMVLESIGEPKYKNTDGWYYGKKCFNKLFHFEGDKFLKQTKVEGLWIDMPLKMLIASYGKPGDEKKNVTKNGTKSKLYFGSRTTRQKTTVYKLEVRVENDKVVGWRDLE